MFDEYITQAASQYSVPEALIRAVIQQESGGNPYAVGKIGEQGLMQLTPKYYPDVNRFDPRSNIMAGTKSLSDYYKRFGDWRGALSYYNGGKNAGGSQAQGYADKVLSRAGMSDGMEGGAKKTEDMFNKAFVGWTGTKTAIETGGKDVPAKELIAGWWQGTLSDEYVFKDFWRRIGLWVLAAFLVIAGTWRLING